MFYLLDFCFKINGNDDLGALLGAISPEICKDRFPADAAVFETWMERLPERKLDSRQLLPEVIQFLRWYGNEFGFDFTQTLNILESEKITADILNRAIQQAVQEW